MKKKARNSTSQSLAKGKLPSQPAAVTARLLGDIRSLIDQARQQTARAVNSAMVVLYWQIGKRIREDVLPFVLNRSVAPKRYVPSAGATK